MFMDTFLMIPIQPFEFKQYCYGGHLAHIDLNCMVLR